MKVGSKHSICNVGHLALNSLRVEQGVPSYGAELNYCVLPQQAGMDSFIDKNKVYKFCSRGF